MARLDEFYKAVNDLISEANAPIYSRHCKQCASAIRFIRIQAPWEKSPRVLPILPRKVKP